MLWACPGRMALLGTAGDDRYGRSSSGFRDEDRLHIGRVEVLFIFIF